MNNPGEEESLVSDPYGFMAKAEEVIVGRRVTKVTCQPVMLPDEPHPVVAFRITVDNGMSAFFIAPVLSGIQDGTREQES